MVYKNLWLGYETNERFKMKSLIATTAFGLSLTFSPQAMAQELGSGSVLQHSGEPGDFIVLRDCVVYWLSEGDQLFRDATVRSLKADSTIIEYNGCVMTIPEKQDVTLDDEFCGLVVADNDSMAQIALTNQSGRPASVSQIASSGNAPLIVGGVVLSAGGIAAATDGGSNGTSSITSSAA